MVDEKTIKKKKINRNAMGNLIKFTLAAVILSFLSGKIIKGVKTPWLDVCGYYIYEVNWIYLLVVIILIFLMVQVMPFTKSYENIWVFLFGVITFIPVNIKVAYFIEEIMFIFKYNFIKGIWCVVFFFVLLSVEEILLGVIARFIWKNQVEFMDEEECQGYLQLCMKCDEYEQERGLNEQRYKKGYIK